MDEHPWNQPPTRQMRTSADGRKTRSTYCSNRWFGSITRRWMCHISTDEDDRLTKDADRSDTGNKNIIHSTKFNIDLQAEIGQCLWRCLVNILRLNTLRGQTNQRITHTFYFSVDRCLARKNDHNQLQTIVSRFEKFKHRFHLFNTRGILAEARLTNNGHASIVRYTL